MRFLLSSTGLRSLSQKWSNTHSQINCVVPARRSAPIWLRDLQSRATQSQNSRASFRWRWGHAVKSRHGFRMRSTLITSRKRNATNGCNPTSISMDVGLQPYLWDAGESEGEVEVTLFSNSSILQFPLFQRFVAFWPYFRLRSAPNVPGKDSRGRRLETKN